MVVVLLPTVDKPALLSRLHGIFRCFLDFSSFSKSCSSAMVYAASFKDSYLFSHHSDDTLLIIVVTISAASTKELLASCKKSEAAFQWRIISVRQAGIMQKCWFMERRRHLASYSFSLSVSFLSISYNRLRTAGNLFRIVLHIPYWHDHLVPDNLFDCIGFKSNFFFISFVLRPLYVNSTATYKAIQPW